MKRFILSAVLVLVASAVLAQSRAPQRCVVGSDFVGCFAEPFAVEAYSDANTATAFFHNVASNEHAMLITTNDQTRRALIVYPWDYSRGPLPQQGPDGYVSEFYFDFERDQAMARWRSLTDDQRAGGFLISIGREFLGGGTLLLYRTFDQVIHNPN